MRETVLITGGAGFIGSHLSDELLHHGYRVRILDNLSPQIHGPAQQIPSYLDSDAELIVGDVRDADTVARALIGVDAVVHFAARVGVGQSMYEIADYTSTNVQGTAVLLEALLKHPVRRLLVASSMSIYGEGLYRDDAGKAATGRRSTQQLSLGDWEVRDAAGVPLTPAPTPETKPIDLASIYALSKQQQEQMCLIFGDAYQIPTVALRFFNVYGPRQALSNPYTGVLAIFAARLLNGKPPLVYEDGRQRRDFVHVSDVARACRLSLESAAATGRAINIGSGQDVAIAELAQLAARAMDLDIYPLITGQYRKGDIRNCFADITLAGELLDYRPRVTLEDGVRQLAPWLAEQTAEDRVEQANKELQRRGLTV